MGIQTIGEIACTDPELLRARFGKGGISLWRYANGMDDSRVRRVGEEEPPQSIGNSVTLARNIENERQARQTMLLLAESVASRLRRQNLRCRTVEVALRSEQLQWKTHRMRLRYATDITAELAEHGMELLRQSHSFSSPLHSMGLRGLELVHADEDEQMDMLVDYVNLNTRLWIRYAANTAPAASGARASSVSRRQKILPFAHCRIEKTAAPL